MKAEAEYLADAVRWYEELEASDGSNETRSHAVLAALGMADYSRDLKMRFEYEERTKGDETTEEA